MEKPTKRITDSDVDNIFSHGEGKVTLFGVVNGKMPCSSWTSFISGSALCSSSIIWSNKPQRIDRRLISLCTSFNLRWMFFDCVSSLSKSRVPKLTNALHWLNASPNIHIFLIFRTWKRCTKIYRISTNISLKKINLFFDEFLDKLSME